MIQRALWCVVSSMLALLSATLPAPAQPAAGQPIRWTVVNNFGLLSGADTQSRYKRESDAYIGCMRKRFSPGQCDNRRDTFGLTQQPYHVRFESGTFKYDHALVHPAHGEAGNAYDHVVIALALPGAAARARCDWTVAGRDIRNASCQDARAPVPLDKDVPVSVTVRGGQTAQSATVNVRRVVIVTFGDSFMSGEGNPHIRSSVQPVKSESWLEPRCHRSLLTSSAIAAFRWADANPHAYVAYLNFACSGSTGPIGLIGQYEGIISSRTLDNLRGEGEEAVHFRGRMMPSQLEQARDVLCAKDTCIAPDVTFLSIGINTLGFAKVITELGNPNCGDACLERMQREVKNSFEELSAGENALRAIYERVSREISPKAAFAIEYPDPTRDQDGKFCAGNVLFPVLGKLGLGRVDARENKWAFDKVLEPLNKLIVDVAGSTPGWQVITGSVETTRRNGFCSTQKFFNSGQDAKGTSGTLHPNAAGHAAIAQLLYARLAAILNR